MRRRTPALVGLVLVALVFAGCSTGSLERTSAPTLPDVTLQAFDSGPSLALASLRGPAVVNVWASWCGPCRRELPRYQAFAQKYAGQVKVLGIDFQDPRHDKAQQLVDRTGVRYPLYRDLDGAVHATVLPELILVDARGRVAHRAYVEIRSVAQLEQLVRTHLGDLRSRP